MNTQLIRVALADDHPVIRMGIEAAIEEVPTLRLVGTASDSTGLVELLDSTPCDVLVTDYAMPGGCHGDGMELLNYLRGRFPQLRIVVITGLDQPAMIQALHATGIEHILSKADEASHVTAAINAANVNRRYLSPRIAALLPGRGAASSPPQLSPREYEVLCLYVSGLSINAIAEKLQRRKQTVSTQKVNGMAKLAIETDADLFKYAAELGLRPPPSTASADAPPAQASPDDASKPAA